MLVPSFAIAKNVNGYGEFNYGPDLSQNVACQFALEKAKEDAIAKFLGEGIEAKISEQCINEDCDFRRETYTETKGTIRKILSQKQERIEYKGYTSCVVDITADVMLETNDIKFVVKNVQSLVKANDEVNFTAVANKPGQVTLFNLYAGRYYKVYTMKIASNMREFEIPSPQHRIRAVLPEGKTFSKEMMMFLFTDSSIELKAGYTPMEMDNLLSTIPFSQRKAITRYVNIMK